MGERTNDSAYRGNERDLYKLELVGLAAQGDRPNVAVLAVGARNEVLHTQEVGEDGNFTLPAEVLKQMGLPPGRVEALYRPPTAPIDPKHPEVVCDQCQGVGYFGRTAIFELLLVDDELRNLLATTPKLDALRAAARKAKHRTLQEEGVLLVARGITSLQELLRVLKQ